jgi:hypothetical protein
MCRKFYYLLKYIYFYQCEKLPLAKCECKMILASISIQVRVVLAMVGQITIIYCSPVDVAK